MLQIALALQKAAHMRMSDAKDHSIGYWRALLGLEINKLVDLEDVVRNLLDPSIGGWPKDHLVQSSLGQSPAARVYELLQLRDYEVQVGRPMKLGVVKTIPNCNVWLTPAVAYNAQVAIGGFYGSHIAANVRCFCQPLHAPKTDAILFLYWKKMLVLSTGSDDHCYCGHNLQPAQVGYLNTSVGKLVRDYRDTGLL